VNWKNTNAPNAGEIVGKKSRAKLAFAGTIIVNIVELILGVTYESLQSNQQRPG
jgi:hypothetical protein